MSTPKFGPKGDLPTLYHLTKSGKIQEWTIQVEGGAYRTIYGQQGGKIQESEWTECEAKNVGRSNETTAEEQAKSEALSQWTHKLERKYYRTVKQAQNEVVRLPMLAHDFEKHSNKVAYPCHVQPKLDGVRCRAYWDDRGQIQLMSRGGKPYDVPHIVQAVTALLPEGSEFDGELYIHGKSCQQITSLVKRNRDESLAIEYFIYDIVKPDQEEPWRERYKALKAVFKDGLGSGPLTRVQSVVAKEPAAVKELHDRYVKRGFEGAIVRNLDGIYKWGYRSHDLLKLKAFHDAEYEVVDCIEGKGKFKGAAIFVCVTEDGTQFNVTPKASMDVRKSMYRNRSQYINKKYTVRYFELTDDAVPRFPVGILFRDAKDLPQ